MLKYTFKNDYVLGYVHTIRIRVRSCVVGESLFLNMAAEEGDVYEKLKVIPLSSSSSFIFETPPPPRCSNAWRR